MEQSAFKNPFGRTIKNRDGYFTFIPRNLPPKIDYDESLTALTSEASLQLGNLSGIGKLMPNPHLLIRPYVTREAVLSSKIEGTQASILDVFRFQAARKDVGTAAEEKRVVEVVNYIDALEECLQDVNKGTQIDLRMIKKAHKKLMHNVRGHKLQPGNFRRSQNWIGVPGAKIEDATYVPAPPEYVNELVGDLEKFIQNPPGRIPVLIQCAMMHYQFEAIHPFNDGNGRIGRLLIPVLLAQRKLLDQPLLYLSAYVERYKDEYYSLLLAVSQQSKWKEWIRFFLHGVITQASDAVNNIRKLMNLRAIYEKKLASKKASGSVTRLVEYLFSNPIITIPSASGYLGISYPPAKSAVEHLVSMGILIEQKDSVRQRIFIAHEITAILSEPSRAPRQLELTGFPWKG
ncbi:MAG: Fic family protein [Nitrososphaera sp.]